MTHWIRFRHAGAEKQGLPVPKDPQYFIGPPSWFIAHPGEIARPTSSSGRVIQKGERGIVIGKTCNDLRDADIEDCIYGYTCVYDMIFSPDELVQRICRDTLLVAGDLIACGTSVGVLPMRPDTSVEISIDGIGTLQNTHVSTV